MCIICDIFELNPVLFSGRYLQQAKSDIFEIKTFYPYFERTGDVAMCETQTIPNFFATFINGFA